MRLSTLAAAAAAASAPATCAPRHLIRFFAPPDDTGTGGSGNQGGDGAPGGQEGPPGEGGGQGGEGGAGADRGFPEGTPLEQMTTEQQVAYWKHHARQHEARAKSRQDYDAQKSDAERWREHERAQQTPSEQAVTAAREEGRQAALAEARAETATALLSAGLRDRGRSDEQVAVVLRGVSAAGFVNDRGVDQAAVTAYLDAVAPRAAGGGGQGAGRVDLGQGRRGGTGGPTSSSVDAGRQRFAEARARRAGSSGTAR